MEPIIRSCEELLSVVERCENETVNSVIVFAVFDILEFIAKERAGESNGLLENC